MSIPPPSKRNPFLYGSPVPPTRFVGRQDIVKTLFARLYNGESTALIGEPHSGKTSLLRYIADEEVRERWLSGASAWHFFTDVDCHLLSRDFAPADFWRQALAALPHAMQNDTITRQWQMVSDNRFGSFMLEGLFRQLAKSDWRVVLLIDEFDILLHHLKFNAEFFGALRSLATRTNALSLVLAGRTPIAQMNKRGQELNPFGSPFFNNIIEMRLQPFSPDESREVVEAGLAGTGVEFAPHHYQFINILAGRHPFLVQVAASALFDATLEVKNHDVFYLAAAKLFHDRAEAHYDDLWRSLSPTEQTALVILALGELQGRIDGREFNTGDFGRMEWYGPELARLHEWGMVEQVDRRVALAGLTLWQSARWRVASRGLVWWLADTVIAGARQTISFEAWLQDKESRGFLTRDQFKKLRELANNSIPKSAVTSVAQMGALLLKEIVKQ